MRRLDRKEEQERREFILKELRKKNLALFYKDFSIDHRLWLRELTDKYKERGLLPLSPLILADYYKECEDKLLAVLVACILLDDNERVMEQVSAMRKILGEHPYKDFYSNRTFVQLSNGANQTKYIAYFRSTKYYEISKLFDIIWNIEHDYGKKMFEVFFETITLKEYTPYNALLLLLRDFPVGRPEWRVNLALLRLCDKKGISEPLWDLGCLDEKLECPLSKEIKDYLNTWFFEWSRTFTFKEVCAILGFEREIDVYYSMLAFRELSRYKPKEVKDYLKLYYTQFKNGTLGLRGRKKLKARMPKIEFEHSK